MRTRSVILAGLLALLTVAATFPQVEQVGTSDARLHRAIVKFRGGALPADLGGLVDALDVREAVAFETIGAVAVTAPVAQLRALADHPRVEAIRSERELELHLYRSVGEIGAPAAYEGSTYEATADDGTTVTATRPGVDGTGQHVAVLDTGILAGHPDLVGKVAAHRNFEFAWGVELLDASALDAYAEATGPSNLTDDIGHGTHVAGIVAGQGTSSQGRPNHGVAPGATLVDLRIAAGPVQGLVEDTGWERNAIAAFDWLLRHHDDEAFGEHGIRVNTNSWGLTGSDLVFGAPEFDPLAEIIRKVDGAGIVTVFSAGNDGASDNVTDATVPNGLPEVISVAAACKADSYTSGCDPTRDGDMANFTSHGPAVDVTAPGVGILSTVPPASLIGALSKIGDPDPVFGIGYGDHFGGSPEQQAAHRAAYGTASGTSMSGPHVAGAAALVLAANPGLTTAEVADILASTADDMLESGHDIASGHGMIDVAEAVDVAHRATLDLSGDGGDPADQPGERRGKRCDRDAADRGNGCGPPDGRGGGNGDGHVVEHA